VRRLQTLHVFLVDNHDGDEGIAAYMANPRLQVPMIATSDAKLKQLQSLAADMAARSGQRIRLVRFERRVDLGEVEPQLEEEQLS
jgi:hypothetical protein